MGRIRANLVVALVILAVMCVWGLLRPGAARSSVRPRPSALFRGACVGGWIRDRPVAGVFRNPASRPRLVPRRVVPRRRFSRLFRIIGTVVTNEARDVVPRAPIRAIAGFESASPQIALAEAADDGTFSIDLTAEGVIWVAFNAETPLGAGPVSIDVKPPFEGIRDLGRDRARAVHRARVQSPDGRRHADRGCRGRHVPRGRAARPIGTRWNGRARAP